MIRDNYFFRAKKKYVSSDKGLHMESVAIALKEGQSTVTQGGGSTWTRRLRPLLWRSRHLLPLVATEPLLTGRNEWRTRSAAYHIQYLYMDGWYRKVRFGKQRARVPVLVVFGVRGDGQRIVLDMRIAGKESAFLKFPNLNGRRCCTTNALERINEEFRRRTKTQASLPSQDAVLLLMFGLLRTGQIRLRKLDG